jgi:hypothetical protein
MRKSSSFTVSSCAIDAAFLFNYLYFISFA